MLAAIIPVDGALPDCKLPTIPPMVCVTVDYNAFNYGPFENLVGADTSNAIAYAGFVDVEPQGLGPYRAFAVGATSPCDMFVNANCQVISSEPLGLATTNFETAYCIDRWDAAIGVYDNGPTTNYPVGAMARLC